MLFKERSVKHSPEQQLPEDVLCAELFFSHYWRYEFFLSGVSYKGTRITASLGSQDPTKIYYLSLTKDTKFIVKHLIDRMRMRFYRQQDGSFHGIIDN